MPPIRFFDDLQGQRLARTLKAVRRLRGMTAADAAREMGMPLRSYEHFESGAGRFDFLKVRRFAEVMDADPFAILIAVMIESPRFAVASAGNKAATALLVAIEQLDRDLGDRLAQVDTAALMAEVGEAFQRLRTAVDRSQSFMFADRDGGDDPKA